MDITFEKLPSRYDTYGPVEVGGNFTFYGENSLNNLLFNQGMKAVVI